MVRGLSAGSGDSGIYVALSQATFASRATMAGAHPRTVAELLGDKTLYMAMRYSHLAPDFTLDAVRRMEAKFQADSTPVAPEPTGEGARVN